MKIDVDVSCFSEHEVWDILDGLLDARKEHVLAWVRERAEYVMMPTDLSKIERGG